MPRKTLLNRLLQQNTDIFTFIQRTFLGTVNKYSFHSESEQIGLLVIESYDRWLRSTKYNARRCVKKASRMGVETRLAEIDDEFVNGAAKIYNETPFRQGRRYSGYGLSLNDVRKKFERTRAKVLGAYFKNELIGILCIHFGDRVAAYSSFVSLTAHRDKCPNNALVAESVRMCCTMGYRFLTYGNMGYLPNLDFFKNSHGFRIFNIPRYYIPLSTKGRLSIRLGLHKPLEHSVPRNLQRALIPLYNLASRGNVTPEI